MNETTTECLPHTLKSKQSGPLRQRWENKVIDGLSHTLKSRPSGPLCQRWTSNSNMWFMSYSKVQKRFFRTLKGINSRRKLKRFVRSVTRQANKPWLVQATDQRACVFYVKWANKNCTDSLWTSETGSWHQVLISCFVFIKLKSWNVIVSASYRKFVKLYFHYC